MSVDDINTLKLGEQVEVKMNGLGGKVHLIKGTVQGIDLWEKRVRVAKDEYTCDWFPPRLINRCAPILKTKQR